MVGIDTTVDSFLDVLPGRNEMCVDESLWDGGLDPDISMTDFIKYVVEGFTIIVLVVVVLVLDYVCCSVVVVVYFYFSKVL